MNNPGRKPSNLSRVMVMLDPQTLEIARLRGKGNLSAGLRELVGAASISERILALEKLLAKSRLTDRATASRPQAHPHPSDEERN